MILDATAKSVRTEGDLGFTMCQVQGFRALRVLGLRVLGHLFIIVPEAYFGRVGSGSNNRSRATCLIGPTISGSDTAK